MEAEGKERLEIKKALIEAEKEQLNDLRQKSRIMWAIEGDEKFFHGIFNSRMASNRINGMVVNGEWVDNPQIINEEAVKFFGERYSE